MDLERCRALLCVVETGSLTAAAGKMGYTTSGISRMMAALEEELGFVMLTRYKAGIRPTPDCLRMIPAIRELLFREEKCRQLAAEIRGAHVGSVTIGTAYSAYYTWLTQVTAAFHVQYPEIRIQFRGGRSTELLDLLEKRELDLCIISQREGAHKWIPLCRDEMVAWVPANHPYAQLSALPIAAFETEPYIDTYPGTDIDNARIFAKYGVTPNTSFTTLDSLATYSMIEAGLGIGMNNGLDGVGLTGNVKVLPLDPPQVVEIGMAVLPEMAPAVENFVKFAQEHVPRLERIKGAD